MNWLDVIIFLFLVLALFRGIQSGFVRQIFSTLGFLVGVLLGAWVQGYLIDLMGSSQSKALLSLVVILGFALGCMTLGEYVGLRLKGRVRKFKIADKTDRILGSFTGGLAVLLAVWLGAAIFGNTPPAWLQQQIRTSRVVAGLNDVLPDAPVIIAKIGTFINPNNFPQVFTGLEPKLHTDAPLPDLGALGPAVEKTRESVVKVAGEGCGGIVEGSGFVAADGTVATNAHVVAGVKESFVIDTNGKHAAKVIWFDPDLDLAVLRTSDLAGQPLALDTNTAASGTQAVVLGYPESQGFTAGPAAVLEAFRATGRDIYNQGATERSVYSVKADIRHGNSGGPLVNAAGAVIGVIFAESTAYEDVGYALTMDQVTSALAQAKARTQATSTGSCAQ